MVRKCATREVGDTPWVVDFTEWEKPFPGVGRINERQRMGGVQHNSVSKLTFRLLPHPCGHVS
jgi:hypothetical protein